MSFDYVYHTTQFPKSFGIEDGELLELGLIGMQSLSVQDSLLVVSTLDAEGYWSFFRLPDCSFLGNVLRKGRGAGEFMYSPRVGNQYFYRQGGSLYSLIYDFASGSVTRLDVTRTLDEKRPVIRPLEAGQERQLFNFVCLDTATFFCRAVNAERTQLQRYISEGGERRISAHMAVLNEASVSPGSDVNILGTYCRYNPKENLMVEASMDLSLINLYSLGNGMSVSICPEPGLDRIRDVEQTDKFSKKVAYCHLAAYDDFFAALYHGDTTLNIHDGTARSQRIQIYSWKGLPLAELVLDRVMDAFDMDVSHGVLYTLNYDSDEIRRYDIREVLAYLSTAVAGLTQK